MASRSSASRSTASTATNVRRNLFHHHLSKRPNSVSTSTTATTVQEQDYDSEIVTRDRNGNYEVSMPSLPSLDEDQAQDEDVSEQQKHDTELIERCKGIKVEPYEQAELLEALRSRIRQKVESLDEDNWMFEAEKEASS